MEASACRNRTSVRARCWIAVHNRSSCPWWNRTSSGPMPIAAISLASSSRLSGSSSPTMRCRRSAGSPKKSRCDTSGIGATLTATSSRADRIQQSWEPARGQRRPRDHEASNRDHLPLPAPRGARVRGPAREFVTSRNGDAGCGRYRGANLGEGSAISGRAGALALRDQAGGFRRDDVASGVDPRRHECPAWIRHGHNGAHRDGCGHIHRWCVWRDRHVRSARWRIRSASVRVTTGASILGELPSGSAAGLVDM